MFYLIQLPAALEIQFLLHFMESKWLQFFLAPSSKSNNTFGFLGGMFQELVEGVVREASQQYWASLEQFNIFVVQ